MIRFSVTRKGKDTIFWETNTTNLSKAVRRLYNLFGEKISYDVVEVREIHNWKIAR